MSLIDARRTLTARRLFYHHKRACDRYRGRGLLSSCLIVSGPLTRGERRTG